MKVLMLLAAFCFLVRAAAQSTGSSSAARAEFERVREVRRMEVLLILLILEDKRVNDFRSAENLMRELRSTRGPDFTLPYSNPKEDYTWWKTDSAFFEGYCWARGLTDQEECPKFRELKHLVR